MMFGSFPVLFGLLVTWATPLWLVSVGLALGVILLGVGYGVLWLVSRRAAEAAVSSVREGILQPIFYLVCFATVFAALGMAIIPGLPVKALLGAVSRLSTVGGRDYEFEVPASEKDYKLSLDVRIPELRWFSI